MGKTFGTLLAVLLLPAAPVLADPFVVTYSMDPTCLWRYAGLGTAALFPADIRNIQAMFGSGPGSVHPLEGAFPAPEPGTVLLLGFPLASLLRRRRQVAGQIVLPCTGPVGRP